MLARLRASAQGFFAKIILLLLVGSFVIWGIGDIFRNGGGLGSVATVGRTTISVQEYRLALRRKQEELRQMLGSAYKPEIVEQLHIGPQVLMGLINRLLLEKEAENLGLIVSDAEVLDTIRRNPAFQDRGARFDKTLYLAALRNAGIAEARYVAGIKEELATTLLLQTFASGWAPPNDFVLALYRVREEQRSADLIVVPPNSLAAPVPTSGDLETYYRAHAKAFMAPETRTVSYVTLTLPDVASRIQVSEDELRRAYEDRKGELRTLEKRDVQQLLFAREEEARTAASRLKEGISIAEAANTLPLLNKGKTALGEVTRDDLPAEAASAVFALPEGGTSAPIASGFGWHVFHVSRITPAAVPNFAAVRGDLEREIKAREAQDSMYKIVGSLEDALAGGATLENAAERIGQPVQTIGPMTREGLSPEGKKRALPPYENFLGTAFSTGEKAYSQAVQAPDGSYFLLRVDSVSPERAKALDAVRTQVAQAWQTERRSAALKKRADEIAAALHAGKALAASGIERSVTGPLKRASGQFTSGALAGNPVPRGLELELFRIRPGETTGAYRLADGGYAVARLTRVAPAPGLAPAAAATALAPLRAELKNALGTEMLHHYLAYLRAKHRVTVNESALASSGDAGE